MKIAIFTDTFPPAVNGVSTYTYKLAEWMSKKHEVAVFTIGRENKYEKGEFEVYWVKGTILKTYPQYSYRVIPPYRDLLPVIREFSPHVIHSHSPITMGAVAELASRRFKIPLVSTYHTSMINFIHLILDSKDPRLFYTRIGVIRKLLHKLVDLAAYPAYYYYFDDSDLIISPSDFVTNELLEKGIAKEKIVKIPNFISIPKEVMKGEEFREKWGIDNFMVLHVGRLSWEKRIEKAIEAVAPLKDVQLVVTSKGPYGEKLKEFARKMGAENVIFTGFLPEYELFGAYDACDVFITPSPYDTFNISAAQATAFGKPIIGFKSGINEFVIHGKNGFIVESYESEVENYRKWIKLLKEDEKLRKRMGKESKKISKMFELERVMRKIEEVYEKVEYEKYKRRRYIYALALILLLMRTARI